MLIAQLCGLFIWVHLSTCLLFSMTSTMQSTHFNAAKISPFFVGSSQTISITTLALSLCSLVSKYVHDRLWLLVMHKLEASSQNIGKTLLGHFLPEPVATTTPTAATKKLQSDSASGKQKKKAVSRRIKPKKVNRRRRKRSNISSSESESEGEVNIASEPSSSDESLVCDFDDNLSDREENVDLLDSLSDSDKEISHSSSHEDTSKALTNSPFQKGRRQIVLAANFSSPQTSRSNLKETSQLESEATAGRSEDFSQVVHNLCNILLQEDCFIIMKVFSDWLQAYPAVIATCSKVLLLTTINVCLMSVFSLFLNCGHILHNYLTFSQQRHNWWMQVARVLSNERFILLVLCRITWCFLTQWETSDSTDWRCCAERVCASSTVSGNHQLRLINSEQVWPGGHSVFVYITIIALSILSR